jgi:hypothetical protein
MENIPLADRQVIDRVAGPVPTDETAHHLGVDRRPSAGHAADRLGEGADIRHAILQQVTDTLGSVAQKVDRVAVLEELRQDQHRDLGPNRSDLPCCAESVVAEPRRHLDIDYGDVGPVGAHLAHEIVSVAGRRDDIEPRPSEDVYDPLPEQGLRPRP